jgi:hypothetical protein
MTSRVGQAYSLIASNEVAPVSTAQAASAGLP